MWLSRHPRQASRLAAGSLLLSALAFPATVLLADRGAGILLSATLVFRIAYAGCDVPHNALMTRLGDSAARATWLARGRTIGTAIASLLAAWGASGRDIHATTALLWGLSIAALLIGSAMVPLLAACPPDAGPSPGPAHDRGTLWLPWQFLTASIIGIVALGALAKAVLHLPAGIAAPVGGTTILALLIAGRTISAFVPLRMTSRRTGLAMLAATYSGAGLVALLSAWTVGPVTLVLLGLSLGLTNLVGWALLPALAKGPRGYGLYTMASKLALGSAGLALAGGLGRVPTFTPAAFPLFAAAIAAACGVAALLAWPRLTSLAARALSVP